MAYRRRGSSGLSMLFVVHMLWQEASRLPYKPPVTLSLITAQVLLYFQVDFVASSICLHPAQMIAHGDMREWLRRIIVSAFVHGDEMHLYYNMASFLYKGVSLEYSMGSEAFARLVAILLLLSQVLNVFVSFLAYVLFGYAGFASQCAVGFSGVLFALKSVLNAKHPEAAGRVWGFRVPSRYAPWIELALIQLLVPNASLVGHLCGVLAGLLYVWMTRHWPALISSLFALGRRPQPRPRFRGGGAVGGAPRAAYS